MACSKARSTSTEYNRLTNLMRKLRPYDVDHLYKYRSMDEHSISVFENNEVFYSDPTSFNDPFDCRPHLIFPHDRDKTQRFLMKSCLEKFPTMDREARRKMVKERMMGPNLQETVIGSYVGYLKKAGVFCLSEKRDDLLMWSHYSESHKGYCLEFATSPKSDFSDAMKVLYSDTRPDLDMIEESKHELFQILHNKGKAWEYEEERRIVDFGGSGIHHFPPEVLTGVIFGAKISDEDRDSLRCWISQRDRNINIYQATIHDRQYKLNIERVN
jgi:hypothetical protein